MTPWGSLGEPVVAPLQPALCFGPRYMVVCAQQGVVGMLGDWWMFLAMLLTIILVAFLAGWFARAYVERKRDRAIVQRQAFIRPGDLQGFDPRPPARKVG